MTALRHTMWTVGSKATAEVLEWSKSQPPALSLSLDPGDVLIPVLLRKGEPVMFVAFLLDLAEAALLDLAEAVTKLAKQLDPDGMPAPPEMPVVHRGRHAMVRDEFGESGGGHG
jgi:hypothetical protein